MVMRLLDLFSGIGGFSYAAEKLVGGYETVAFCEQDEFCQQVLRKHWKDVPIYDDVRTIDATGLGNIDIVAGGFPCQAVSQAGLQKATEDDRWLWDEMLRIIQDCKPRWVIGENVVGLININQGILFEQVQTDLEKEGYSVQSVVIPAASKNAPHRRDRVCIIAHSNINSQSRGIVADTENRRGEQTEWQGWESSRRGSQDIDGSETEREEAIATDVPNTKRMGWTERAEIREASQRKGWADKSSNSSSTVTETEDATNSKSKRLQGWSECTTISKEGNKISDIRSGSDKDNVSNTISERGCSRQTRREDAEDVRERSTSKKHRRGNSERRMGYMANGLSEALFGHFSEEPKEIPRVTQNQKDRTKKLKALGNSIVPQVAAELFYAIRIAEYGE